MLFSHKTSLSWLMMQKKARNVILIGNASSFQFFTDLILARHARKLLSSFRLRDLGRFSAHLDFDLTAWFTKER